MPAEWDDLYQEYVNFGAQDVVGYGQFNAFLDIYQASGSVQDDPDADVEMFYQFLNAFVPDVEPHTKEWWDNIRLEYYNLAEIAEERIDWDVWRRIIEDSSS